jgi:3-hydroxy acid dehydrogenase/malonic semialdehyde reductase
MKSNPTIFITGATSGFGRALALMCAKKDYQVIATGRREERLKEIEDKNIRTITLDVRDREAVNEACSNLEVDILVNNAGLALGLNSYEKQSPDHCQQMIDTNINGVLHVTHALLPGMVARDSGHIVNLSSIAGSYPYPGGNVYGATKAFLTQFSLNLRADLLGKNIRVTSIEPGMCDTEFSIVRFDGDKKKADQVYQGMQPLTAEDIANTILWCLEQPKHVNINRVEVMPVMQAFSPFAVSRNN